ncbi:hypothetical protein STEG23_002110 [Scotinomys teguina]
MSYHVRSHNGAAHKPYNCSHSGKSFSWSDHPNSQIRQMHSTEWPFKCEKCETAFATKDRLMRTQYVTRSFTTAAYLLIHTVKDHGLQVPQADSILCKLCSLHCKTPAQLAGHMQTHLGVVPLLSREMPPSHSLPAEGDSCTYQICALSSHHRRGFLQKHMGIQCKRSLSDEGQVMHTSRHIAMYQ